MLCVERDENGEIVSVRKEGNGPEGGMKPAVDEEILDFLSENSAEDSIFHLESTDLDMVRVLEDLIDLMVSKNVITFSELPAQAQKKLLSRQQMRKRIGGAILLKDEDVL